MRNEVKWILVGIFGSMLLASCGGGDTEEQKAKTATRSVIRQNMGFSGLLETDLKGIAPIGFFSSSNCVQMVKYEFSDGSPTQQRLDISTEACPTVGVIDVNKVLRSMILKEVTGRTGVFEAYDPARFESADGLFAMLAPDVVSKSVTLDALCGMGFTDAGLTANCTVVKTSNTLTAINAK